MRPRLAVLAGARRRRRRRVSLRPGDDLARRGGRRGLLARRGGAAVAAGGGRIGDRGERLGGVVGHGIGRDGRLGGRGDAAGDLVDGGGPGGAVEILGRVDRDRGRGERLVFHGGLSLAIGRRRALGDRRADRRGGCRGGARERGAALRGGGLG